MPIFTHADIIHYISYIIKDKKTSNKKYTVKNESIYPFRKS